ncbi:hypothetical protein MCAP1_000385c, partial [Malassezia caprae]
MTPVSRVGYDGRHRYHGSLWSLRSTIQRHVRESSDSLARHQDYFCIERPLSPPVRRLVIGSYHLEYGFPSTHSANAVGMSIALYYFLIQIRKTISFLIDFKLMEPHGWALSLTSQPVSELLLLFYACTVIYGRLYLGMHSVIGAFLGVLSAFEALFFDNYLDKMLQWRSFFVVSFMGAFVGVAMGNWRTNNYFYEDMDRLDMVLRGITKTLPSKLTWGIATLWNNTALQSNRGKVVASMIFGTLEMVTVAIVPLVAWKALATPLLKRGIPKAYRICKGLLNQQVGKVSDSGATRPSMQQKGQKEQPQHGGKTVTEHVCTLHCTTEDRFCIGMCFLLTQDVPRLLIYTGIGFLGATFSHYLISYYDVKVFQLVV